MGSKFKVNGDCFAQKTSAVITGEVTINWWVIFLHDSLNQIYICNFLCLATLVIVSHIVTGIYKILDKIHRALISIIFDFIL
jgi:hypothetical protein